MVRDLQEMHALRLKLDELAFRQLCACDSNWITLVQSQRLHHPIWEMNATFLSNELENTRMCGYACIGRVAELEHPWRVDVEVGGVCKG